MTYNFPSHINGDSFDGVRFSTNINGSPINLTNATIEMTVYAGSEIAVFSTTNGKLTIINPPTSGIFEFDKQIVHFNTTGTFNYKIVYKTDAYKTYVTGTWTITQA
jgi:hypothetical protein